MIFPQLVQFTDIALLLLRLMVGIVFITSSYKHLKDPATRSKDIGMSKSFTIFLGAAGGSRSGSTAACWRYFLHSCRELTATFLFCKTEIQRVSSQLLCAKGGQFFASPIRLRIPRIL